MCMWYNKELLTWSILQEYVNDYPQYVKVVNALGYVQHRPWASVYSRMGESAGITSPG